MITHKAIIGGQDVSKDLISVHAEQALGMNSDPAKIDIVLCNFGNRYTGAFLPRADEVDITIYNIRTRCNQLPSLEAWVVIKRGQIQKVAYASDKVKIEATCQLGTLADAFDKELAQHLTTVSKIIQEIPELHLDPQRSIKIKNVKVDPPKQQQIHRGEVTFLDALDYHAMEMTSVYFTDPKTGEIVFTHPVASGGAVDADGYVMHQEDADNAVGRRNVVYVIGSNMHLPATEPGSEIETHKVVMGKAEDQGSIQKFGRLVAPIVFRPYLTKQEDCDQVAQNLLAYYSSFEDVARIKIFGKAPYPLQTVLYAIRSNVKGQRCDGRYMATATTAAIDRVMRRVIDYSKDGFYAVIEGPAKPSGGFGALPSQSSQTLGKRIQSWDGKFWWYENSPFAFAKLDWFKGQLEMRGNTWEDVAPGSKFFIIGKPSGSGTYHDITTFNVIRQDAEVPSGWKIIEPWLDESITDPNELVKIETWKRTVLAD